MNTKSVMMLTAAACMLSGCLKGDPNVYTATPEEMAKAMIGKSSTYKRAQYTHVMRVTGGSSKGVNVSLSADGRDGDSCRIRFEAVDASSTRIVPDCGPAHSAQAESLRDFAEVKVLEQAKHILTGEPVNVAFLESALTTHAMKNLPKMQKEALQMDAEMRQMRNEMEASAKDAQAAAGGWGS